MNSLFLAPHNDDETLFGTFTLLRHQPHVIVCLRSFRMADPHYPGGMPVEYKTREFETEMAMKNLGCSWDQWLMPDSKINEDVLWEMLRIELEKQYDRVFIPAWEENGNEQHNTIAAIAGSVFQDIEIVEYLTYTAGGKSHGANEVPFEPEWVARKLHAMACYKSQAAHPATCKHFIDYSIREFYA